MRATTFLFSAAALLCSAAAGADSFDATRDQPMHEERHEVWLKIRDGVAQYRVERAFHNGGTQHDEATVAISLPPGAAATGLRIKVGDAWLDGELMRRERAAELYRELTGIGPHPPKDPAILYWNWASQVTLRVFPVAPGRTSTVGYALTAPTSYRDGRYYVPYPKIPAGNGLSAAMLRVDGKAPMIDGRPVDAALAWQLAADEAKPAWFGDHAPDASGSYVKSDIAIAEDDQTRQVAVTVDIQHTYRGDLRLELVTPDGVWHPLSDVTGGGENDVRETFSLRFDAPVRTKGTWRLVVSDHAGLDTGRLERWSLDALGKGDRHVRASASDTPVFIPDAPQAGDGGQATISVEAPPIDIIAGRVGSVPASADEAFFRLEIDTAPQLAPLPEGLQVVFVLDASRSLPEDDLDAQLALVRAFVRHVPDAEVELVLVRRHASRLFDRFVPAKDLDAALAGATARLALGNGSALDAGIRLAGEALGRRRGPKTIVLLTDALLRPSWDNRLALAALKKVPAGTTTHLVLPAAGSRVTSDERDDAHALAPIARRGGGVALHVRDIHPSKELDAIALGLVRPIRIDNLRIDGVAFPDDVTLPARLEEGDGLREMAKMPKAPKRVTVRGDIWARPFAREIEATLAFSEATAAFVFSHDMHHGLDEDEMFRLAMIGKAVSPVTSYLAIEPGVRPSTIGLELTGIGSGGGGFGAGFGRGAIGTLRKPPPFDIAAALADDVDACVKAHAPGSGWSAKLVLSLTYEEIVDVGAPAGAFGACLADAAWKVMLPAVEFVRERDTREIALP